MWFYEYHQPHGGDSMRWDCGECLSYRRNSDRNCGGKFPESQFAKKGYDLIAIEVFECPKTFVKRHTLDLIRFVDSFKLMTGHGSMDMNLISARFVEVMWLIEEHRKYIQRAIDANQKLRNEVSWQDSQKKL